MVWEGGLAIYGGVIAAVIVILIYARVKKLPAGVFFDVGGLGLLIGQAVGRWGNFINREAFGGETDLPWKMGLTTVKGTFFVHPMFLYESLWNIVGFVGIHIFSKKYRKYDGQVFLLYLAWYGFGRFLIEGLRTDSLYLGNTDIRVSQLVAALTFSVAVFLLLRNKMRRKCTPDDLFVNRAGGDQAAVAQTGTDERADGQSDDGDHHESDTSDAAMKAADE
jgi:phosphatidylglycerol:prolipoprotein diacylglycerol transferase